MLIFNFFVTFLAFQIGDSSVVVKNSGVELYNRKMVLPNENKLTPRANEQPKLELIIDVKNLSHAQMFNNHTRKNRRGEKFRRRKEKNGKMKRNKSQKTIELDSNKQALRNNEKDTLVRNKTIEILKNGVKILSAGENYTQGGNKTVTRVNETLLEKILSSAVSKPDLLISASGIYKLPIGGGVYSSKKLSKSDIAEENYIRSTDANKTEIVTTDQTAETHDMDQEKDKRPNDKQNTTLADTLNKDYEYEYESFDDFKDAWNRNDLNKSFEKSYATNPDYESINLDYNIEATLEQIISVLKNLTSSKKNCSKYFNCSEDESRFIWNGENDDPCQRWLECKENLESAFLGENNHLPSCPCSYPSTIFYDDKVWDENQNRFFRWRDASSEAERLDIYKPGASYCIRSLLAQGSSSIASQHCCYDRYSFR